MSHNHSTDTPVLAQESDNSTCQTVSTGAANAAAKSAAQTSSPPLLSTESKAGLRRHLLQTRRDLAANQRAQLDAQIDQQLLNWWQQQRPNNIGVYWPIQAEPDLIFAYRDLVAAGVALSLPVVQGQNLPLRYARWRPGMAMTTGAMGVPIPAEIEWVELPTVLLIPCVGHTALGYRLGYGGGFYDRTLAHSPRPYTIGISYPCLLANFAHDEHDIALDMILTGT